MKTFKQLTLELKKMIEEGKENTPEADILKKEIEDIKSLSETVRNSIFLASSRTYSETYMEPLLRRKYNLTKSVDNSHDAINQFKEHGELKSSKTLRKVYPKRKEKSLLNQIISIQETTETNRMIPFADCKTADYLSNIQNIKRDDFEYMYYVLLFEDCAKIFFIKSEDVEKVPNWSPKHGRYDELGKSGQFPIDKSNIQYHLNNHLIDTMTWIEITDIYIELSK
jgi:hypothetical protein